MDVQVRVLLAWQNNKQCPKLTDLLPYLWPKVNGSMAKRILGMAMPDFTYIDYIGFGHKQIMVTFMPMTKFHDNNRGNLASLE